MHDKWLARQVPRHTKLSAPVELVHSDGAERLLAVLSTGCFDLPVRRLVSVGKLHA